MKTSYVTNALRRAPTLSPALLLTGLTALSGSPIAAQTITLDTLSLFRLPGVRVEIEPYIEAARTDGLEPDSLRFIMEAKLRDAGIDILTEDEWQVTIGNPLLLLRLDLVKPSEYFYLYSLRLELQQLVVLARDSTIPAFSATWTSESTVGTVQTANLASLRWQVAQQVDRFISAQAAANRTPYRWVRPVNPEARRHGGTEAQRHGGTEAQRHGGMEAQTWHCRYDICASVPLCLRL